MTSGTERHQLPGRIPLHPSRGRRQPRGGGNTRRRRDPPHTSPARGRKGHRTGSGVTRASRAGGAPWGARPTRSTAATPPERSSHGSHQRMRVRDDSSVRAGLVLARRLRSASLVLPSSRAFFSKGPRSIPDPLRAEAPEPKRVYHFDPYSGKSPLHRATGPHYDTPAHGQSMAPYRKLPVKPRRPNVLRKHDAW